MPVVEQSIVIKAPASLVMKALGAVEDIPDWATVSGTVDHVQGRGVGMTYAWHYKFNNLNFEGHSEVLEQTADTLITRTTGDIDSLWTIRLSPAGVNRTALRVIMEYTAPNTFMEILADIVLEQLNNPGIARENITRFKEMVEAQVDSVEEHVIAHV